MKTIVLLNRGFRDHFDGLQVKLFSVLQRALKQVQVELRAFYADIRLDASERQPNSAPLPLTAHAHLAVGTLMIEEVQPPPTLSCSSPRSS